MNSSEWLDDPVDEAAFEKPLGNEEIGAILGGMIAWEPALQNSLTDSHLDEAIKWARRFQDLYDLVKKYNRDMYVNEILEDFTYERDSVIGMIQHYESMKMGESA